MSGLLYGSWTPLMNKIAEQKKDQARIEASVTYSGCKEVRGAGKAPLYRGQPGYRSWMDGDGDGVACEPYL